MKMENSNNKHNLDELNATTWLDSEFFKEIISKKENSKNVEIKNVNIQPGTSKNDHYASIIFRAIIDYELENGISKSQSLIIKTVPVLPGQKKDMHTTVKFFETEIKMYEEVLPKIEAILRAHGDETKLCANVYYYSLNPYKCIIFEDLVDQGYTTIPSRHCTIEEVKTALLKLSKLHAVSYKMAKDGDCLLATLKDGAFTHADRGESIFIKNAITTFTEVLSNNEDLKVFIPKFQKFSENIVEDIVKTYNAYGNGDRNGIFVLNHGDFHLKNMMIKMTSNGKLDDLMLLDYQLSFFGTPAVDVLYSTIMLFSPEMRLNHRDELLCYYFTNFQKTLKLIEYKGSIPKMIDFQHELLKYENFELFLIAAFLVFNYAFVDEDGDIAKLVEDKEYRAKILQNPELIHELNTLLPRLLYRGAFEE